MENESGLFQIKSISGEKFAASWSPSNGEQWWLSTESDSGELQMEMEHYAIKRVQRWLASSKEH